MTRFIGLVVAIVGGLGFLYALYLYLGPAKGGLMFGYDPVYAGLGCIALLTVGILVARNG